MSESPTIRRARMFAGPNGSGKSVIKENVSPRLRGRYINPDDIEADIRRQGKFDFALWGLQPRAEQLLPFLASHPLVEKGEQVEAVRALRVSGTRLDFSQAPINSYLASALSDFLRKRLLEAGDDFTFETVMSHKDKVEFLSYAQGCGYRTYLYYVCTKDPRINIDRVANRVANGGHAVREDKIVDRYWKSLDLLLPAILASNRAYLFDNSEEGGKAQCFAEFEDGHLTIRSSPQPRWFHTYVLDKTR